MQKTGETKKITPLRGQVKMRKNKKDGFLSDTIY